MLSTQQGGAGGLWHFHLGHFLCRVLACFLPFYAWDLIAILCFMAIVTVEELLVIVAWMKQSRGGIGGQFPLQKHFTPLKLALNTDH